MPQIIDPQSLTVNQIKDDLITYLEGRPDYAVWKDFLESGAGTTITELLAGLGSFLSFHSLGARRESYLTTRRLMSSAINISNTVGYPVNRYSAARLTLTIDRSDPGRDSPIAWSKFDSIGTIEGVNLSILNSYTIPGGTSEDSSIQIELVAGNWNVENWISELDSNYQNFLIENAGIDNNSYEDTLILQMDDGSGYSIIPLTKFAEEMTEYQPPPFPSILRVLERTNIDGVILVFGDGLLGKGIELGDLFQFEYVITSGPLPVVSVIPEDIDLEITGVITDVNVWNPGSGPDSLQKLAVAPAAYYGTQRRMVTGDDHTAILVSYSGDLISSSWDGPLLDPCCSIYLSYLFADRHIMSTTEVADIKVYLDKFKPVGEQIIFTDPLEIGLEVELVVVVDVGTIHQDVEEDITAIIESLTMSVGSIFKIGVVTAEIGKLDYVDRVYLIRPYNDKELNYEEYLYLITTSFTITEDKNIVVSIIPDNDGFLSRLVFGVTTSVTPNKLISLGKDFSNTNIGDLVINEVSDSRALVTAKTSGEVSLSLDIFQIIGESFSIYDQTP